jgi:hypothetical protein
MKTLKGMGIVSLAAVLVCGLVLLTGCQNTREKAAEKMMENAISKATGGRANVDIKGGKVAVTTKDGTSEFSAGSTEWPADLTLDIPKVEGKIKGVVRTSTPQGKNWTIAISGVESGIMLSYVKELATKGWNIGTSSGTEEAGMSQATKDNNMIVLTYTAATKSFLINVTAGPAK